MVDVDYQKIDLRQLLEEDSMPSFSQWMSPQSLSHSESVCTAPDVSEHSGPVAVQIQEPSRSELNSKKAESK